MRYLWVAAYTSLPLSLSDVHDSPGCCIHHTIRQSFLSQYTRLIDYSSILIQSASSAPSIVQNPRPQNTSLSLSGEREACARPLVAAYTSPFTVSGEREACARPASAVAVYTSLIPSGERHVRDDLWWLHILLLLLCLASERHVRDLWWLHKLFFSSFPVGCARFAWFLHAA